MPLRNASELGILRRHMPDVKRIFFFNPPSILGPELLQSRKRHGLKQSTVAELLGDASRQGEVSRGA